MIIGLSGLAGSGKDTVANILAANHGFVRIALADAIKRYCKDIYQFTYDQLWGESRFRNLPDTRFPRERHVFDAENSSCECCGSSVLDSQCYLTPRYALQRMGTEGGRDCYKNVWVEYNLRIINELLLDDNVMYEPSKGLVFNYNHSHTVGVAISDCRFLNEIKAIHNASGKVVRIMREGSGLKSAAAKHASEREQLSIPDSSFDYILDNNASIPVLEERIKEMYRCIK